jgi:hypothetical protein
MADVKDNKFVIGNATVMLAPFSADVFALNPDTHSVGMVKAVTITQEADQIMLKNGITQNTVDTQKSNVNMTTTFEGYEFSAKNLMYALGLQGSVVKRLRGKLTAAAAAAATSFSVESYPIPGDAASLIDAVGDIPNGATLLLQKADQPDNVYPCKAVAATTGTGPYVVTIDALPAGVSFAVGDTVWVVNEINAGSTEQDQYFCAKIVGKLSSNNEPIVVVMPKVKVAKGFNLSFSEQDHSNMPFELTPLVMTKTETTSTPKLAGFEKTIAKAYVGG